MLRANTSVARRPTETLRARARRPRKATRHRRVELHEIIRPSDLGLGQLFMLTREAIIVGNLETDRVALWNPAAERLFGWSAAEAVGQHLDNLIPPAMLRLQRAGLDLYRRSGHGSPIESHRPTEVSVKNVRGEEIRVELLLTTLDYPSRPGGYVLALLRDISDRRRVGLEMAQVDSARETAEQTVRRCARLVQDGVADLGSELRRLRRSAQRLRGQVAQPHAGRMALRARVVEARTERLERQLDVLGTGAAIEARTLDLKLERVNLVPLVNQVVARGRSRGTPHKLNLALPQGLTALVDPQRIEQVVEALLDHALARCPRGCWIDVDLRRPLVGLARLEIRDFGRSVSRRVRQRLRDGGGSDRSLALVRSIVELHGGTLGFEFPDDGGVRAVVTLPTQRGRVRVSAV